MTCIGCNGFGCDALVAVSRRCSTSSAAPSSPRSIAFGEVEAARRPELAEVRLDVVDVERRAGAVGRAQQLDELGDAAGVVAEMRGDARRGVAARASAAPPSPRS